MSTKDRLARVTTMLAAATLLAACGASEEGAGTVRTEDHPELGQILVDTSGKTLYFAEQEADGKIRCVDECLEFWIPVEGGDTTSSGVPALDTQRRADNSRNQLTYQGKPLYTFSMDEEAGDVKGNGLEDDFGGTHFVWRAVTVDGSQQQPPAGGGGY